MKSTAPAKQPLHPIRSAVLATSIAAVLAGAALLRPDSAQAATLFWDQSNTGTSGNWDNGTTTNWSTATPPVTANAVWSDGNVAQFSGVGGTVTITAFVAPTALVFTTNGYNLTDNGTNGLDLNGATTITVNPAISATITTSINSIFSASTLTINGGGTLNIAGINSTRYSGNTITIAGGTTVVAQVNAGLGTGDFALPSSSAFNITSGTLDINGTNQTIASLAGTAGTSIVTNSSATYGTLEVGFNAPSASTTYAGAITDTAAAIETSANSHPAGGLGLLITASSAGYKLVLSGTNTYHGITTVGTALVGDPAILQAGAQNTFSANSVVNVNSSGTLDLNGLAQTIAALDGSGTGKVTNTAASTSVSLTIGNASLTGTLNSAASLVDGAGNGILGLIKNGTYTQELSGNNTYSGATTVNAGTLANGSTTGFSANSAFTVDTNGTLDVNGNNSTVGSLSGAGIVTNTSATYGTLTVGVNAAAASTTFAGRITDTAAAIENTNGLTPAGGLGLNVQGPAGGYTLVLTGTNTYHGITTVGSIATGNPAVLQAGAPNAFSPNSVVDVRAGGTLDLNSFDQTIAGLDGTGTGQITSTFANDLVTLTIGAPSLTGTLTSSASLVDGPTHGVLQLSKNGTYSQVLAGNNTYSGTTGISAGVLAAGSTTGFSANSFFTVDAPGKLDLNGYNSAIAAVSGDGSITNGSGAVTGPHAGAATLTVGSDLGGATFHGILSDGTSGVLSLTKVGAGTQEFTGASTYSGPTAINGGILLATNSTGSATGTGIVSINAGGKIGGTGAVGAMVLNSGGFIAPGASVAGSTLHAASLTWNGGGELDLTLGTASDQLALTGALTKGTAGSFLLNLAPGTGVLNQTNYTLATFASQTGFVASDFTLDGGLNGIVSLTGTELDFTLTGITTTGSIIQNSAPVNTPTNADFIVIGPVTTGGPNDNNTVHTLTFTPGGSLLIHNTLFVTVGPVTLVGGSTLTLDGNLSVSQLRMLYGSLLNGNGSILGDLVNAGLLSPGHSPGHINVSGNYRQTPTGTLKIEIGGRDLSEHDLLTVGGTATLGGTLQLVRLNNFKLKRDEPVTFLTANGGVIGEFATVQNGFPNDTILEPTVVYHSNSVALEAKQGSFEAFADRDGLTSNQKSVARALDSVAFRHSPPKVIDYLDYRKLAELPGDFDKIAPEELTSMFTIGVSLATVQSQNIQRRTDDIRSGTAGFSAAGLAVNGDNPSYSGSFGISTGVAGPNGNDDGKEVKESVPVANFSEQNWGVFLSGTGEWVSVGNTDNARGYDLTSGGFTLGIDYKVTSNFAIGLMAGYTGTSADLVDRGRVYVNGGKIGLYATFFQNGPAAQAPTMSKDSSKDSSKEAPAPAPSIAKGFYADMAVTGGYNSYDTRRSALQGEARGDTDGGELNALFGAGYDFKAGGLTFGPTASFNYTYLGTNEFTEHGSLAPLNIHGGKGESLRTALGLKASYDWKVGGVLIKPEIRAAWQHEYGDSAYELGSSFANGGGDNFTVNGPELGRDSVLLGAGFAIQFNERCSTYFYYDGELGRKNYESNSVTGGFRYAF